MIPKEREKNFVKLKELTSKLSEVPGIIDTDWSLFPYENTEGPFPGMPLLDIPEAGITLFNEIEEDTTIKKHEHDEIEHLVVIDGSMELYFDDNTCLLVVQGESAYIPPKTPHIVKFPEKSKMVEITIPTSKEALSDEK
jgi:quercetin dioxygenase-like cupin family protein